MKNELKEQLNALVASFLSSMDWTFHYDSEYKRYRTGVELPDSEILCNLFFSAEKSGLLMLMVPVTDDVEDPDLVGQLCEYVCRINNGLVIGGFDLDTDNGRILYKIFFDASGGLPAMEDLERGLSIAVTMTELYLPGWKAVVNGRSPAEACAVCEENL